MNFLQFIGYIITVVLMAGTVLGVVSMKYNAENLQRENKKLKEDLQRIVSEKEVF